MVVRRRYYPTRIYPTVIPASMGVMRMRMSSPRRDGGGPGDGVRRDVHPDLQVCYGNLVYIVILFDADISDGNTGLDDGNENENEFA